MKRFTLLLAAIIISLAAISQNVPGFKPLVQDASVVKGVLPNGMTYYLKNYENPKGRAEFFIVHNVGALQEEDYQNGLAHFLEHLAFNGTKNFPSKMMLDYLNKIGVRFGYDVNAYTSKDRTVYNISNVPLIRESILDSVLLMIYDWSGNISCLPEEIEKERGVIREEWRRGDDVRSRMMKQIFALMNEGSKYAKRDVIGDTAVINNFKPSTLTDFYHKWYRPDMQAVVIVGDFDLKMMEAKVKKLFSTIPAAVNPAKKEIYTIPDFDKPLFGVISDPETKVRAVKILFKHDDAKGEQKLTQESIYIQTMATLVSNMMGAKMEITKNSANAGFTSAVVIPMSGSANRWFMQFTMSPVGSDYMKAFKYAFTDIERVKKYGFTQEDLDYAKGQMIKKVEGNMKKVPTMKSEQMVSFIVETFTKGEALMTPMDRLSAEKEVINSITLDQVNESLGKMFREENRIYVVNCPQNEIKIAPTLDQIMELNKSVQSSTLEPFSKRSSADGLGDFSKLPGSKIVKSIPNNKYKGEEWILANGVKVYWTRYDDPSASVTVIGKSKGGLVNVSKDEIPTAKMIRNVSRYRSYSNLDENETKLFLGNTSASAGTDIGLYEESVSGSSLPKDSETLFQLIYLNMTGLNVKKDGFDKMMKRAKESFEGETKDAVIFNDSVLVMKYGTNLLRQIKESDLNNITLDKMNKIYFERFGNAADFTFFITGNESSEKIRPLVEKYLGSLVTNRKLDSEYKGDIKLQNGNKVIDYKSDKLSTPISKISIIYHGKAEYNTKNNISAILLKHILTDRYLKSIREEKGGTYYVGVGASLESVPEKKLSLTIDFDTDPKMKEELVKIIDAEIQDVIKNGPRAGEFESALLFLKKSYSDVLEKKSFLSDRYFSLVINGADLRDGAEEVLKGVKPADVQKLLADLIKQGNRMYFVYGTN